MLIMPIHILVMTSLASLNRQARDYADEIAGLPNLQHATVFMPFDETVRVIVTLIACSIHCYPVPATTIIVQLDHTFAWVRT